MPAYYNENDPYAAQWLRNLIDAGLIARGDVDERSIVDVRAGDLDGYEQCHFFAGIGGWSVALRLAGWPDSRPVWTGSCPCQPFSAAGKGEAADDERHLWPAWFPLIQIRRPAIVFGEQVEAAIGWGWIDAVFADLEAEGYACGAAVLPACGVGAPHIRQRAWFVADAHGGLAGDGAVQRGGEQRQQPQDRGAGRLGNTDREGRPIRTRLAGDDGTAIDPAGGQAALQAGSERALANTASRGLGEQRHEAQSRRGGYPDGGLELGELAKPASEGRSTQPERFGGSDDRAAAEPGRLRDAGGFWDAIEWLACTDGKARPIEPGTFPLAHGIRARPSKLRGYGNAIVPQAAAEFIAACADVI